MEGVIRAWNQEFVDKTFKALGSAQSQKFRQSENPIVKACQQLVMEDLENHLTTISEMRLSMVGKTS